MSSDGGRVGLTLHQASGWVQFDPMGVPYDRIDEYRKATEGSRYVREHRARLTPPDRALTIVVQLRKAGFDVAEPSRELKERLQRMTTQEWVDRQALKKRIARIDDEMFARSGDRMRPYQKDGALWLARMTSALLGDEQGCGKEQPVDEPVLTPTGWRPIGELEVGDFVIGSDGRPTEVIGVFPQGEKDVYRITLADGATTRCGLEHLWFVQSANDRHDGKPGRVMSLAELLHAGVRTAIGSGKWYVPFVEPVQFAEIPRPDTDPYLLGRSCVKRRERAASLGEDEALPSEYVFGSISTRCAVLEGLMDAGGSANADGLLSFSTSSSALAEQVTTIARSLGGSAWRLERSGARLAFHVRMTLNFVPFRSSPVNERRSRPRKPCRSISSIEKVGREESVCIRVAAADHLYVTNDFIVTHNTLQILAALPPDVPVLVVAPTAAMGDWRAQRKWARPLLDLYVVDAKHPIRWPRRNEMVLVNPERLPGIHDVDGVKGRKCKGKLPPEKCRGCKQVVRFLGRPGQPGTHVVTRNDGHTEECDLAGNFLEPKDCPGCHPFLDTIPEEMVVVCDEAQVFKTSTSKRKKIFQAIARIARLRRGRTWLSSGTPVENKPIELWNITQIAGAAETVFGSFEGFLVTFKGKKLRYGGYDYGEPGDEIKERLQRFMLRRLIADVLPEIPERSWGQHEVDLSPTKLRELEGLIRQEGGSVREAIARVTELIERDEIPIDMMSKVRAALATAKIPAMLEIVSDYEEKVTPLVVFSAHRKPVDTLEERPGWVAIHGGMTADEKDLVKDSFQNGLRAGPRQAFVLDERGLVDKNGNVIRRLVARRDEQRGASDRTGKEACKHGRYERVSAGPIYNMPGYEGAACTECGVVFPLGIAITIRAGSVSMTLTRAHHMLFVDREWTPTKNAQAESRCIRFGTTKGVVIITLVANHPLDARVTELLIQKAKLIAGSIDAARDDVHRPLTATDLDANLREAQEAAAFGGKVRRTPRTAEEESALAALHELEFERKDFRLACDLAEEAVTIGLTDAQWRLAIRVAQRGKSKINPNATAAASPAHIADAEAASRVAARSAENHALATNEAGAWDVAADAWEEAGDLDRAERLRNPGSVEPPESKLSAGPAQAVDKGVFAGWPARSPSPRRGDVVRTRGATDPEDRSR